jgi:hypothetical protein
MLKKRNPDKKYKKIKDNIYVNVDKEYMESLRKPMLPKLPNPLGLPDPLGITDHPDGVKYKMDQKKLNKLKKKFKNPDELLEEANLLMGGFGVEALQPEGAWINSYYGNTIALYVNMGDTYDQTLVYDTETGKYLLTSWGDFYEGWMGEHPDRE